MKKRSNTKLHFLYPSNIERELNKEDGTTTTEEPKSEPEVTEEEEEELDFWQIIFNRFKWLFNGR